MQFLNVKQRASLKPLPIIMGDLASNRNIWLTLTNRCNIHCKYCFNYIHKDHEHMDPELVVKIIASHWRHLKKKQS